jgi:hypothetical protein
MGVQTQFIALEMPASLANMMTAYSTFSLG